ncbi:MAG: hypothetical protein P8X69_15095, partial [Maritimibacter sp.]
MITREHIKDDAPSTAIYSDCERYRYMLTRVWEPAGERALFVMLKPLSSKLLLSTQDEILVSQSL